MKLSGVKCISLGVVCEALYLMIGVALVVNNFLSHKDVMGLIDDHVWLHTVMRLIPLIFYWQSYRMLKDNSMHFLKTVILIAVFLGLMIIAYTQMWHRNIRDGLGLLFYALLYYQLFMGLAEVAKKNGNLLLEKKLKRLFLVKLPMFPLVVIAIMVLSSFFAVITAFAKLTTDMPVVQVVYFISFGIVVLLPYGYILKWLYRADKELKV